MCGQERARIASARDPSVSRRRAVRMAEFAGEVAKAPPSLERRSKAAFRRRPPSYFTTCVTRSIMSKDASVYVSVPSAKCSRAQTIAGCLPRKPEILG